MRKLLVVSLLIVSFSVSGCISNITPIGNVADIQKVDLTSNFKTGESCGWMLLSLIGPFGDVSVVKAAQSAGIKKAEVIDYRIENYIIAQRTCALVYGK